MNLEEKQKFMPLNIQLFAEGGEEGAQAQEAKQEDAKQETNNVTSKEEEKKYSDTEMNSISVKNVNKALSKQLKDLGIEDVEEAKAILADAKAKKEASKTDAERTKDITTERDNAILEAMNSKIENALLKKGVSEEKTIRAVRLIDKANIVDEGGKLDVSKLATEVEQVLKEFPELISKTEDETVGFKIGGDGKEDKKTNSLESIEKAMGIKK